MNFQQLSFNEHGCGTLIFASVQHTVEYVNSTEIHISDWSKQQSSVHAKQTFTFLAPLKGKLIQ